MPDALQSRIAAIVPGTYLGNSEKFLPSPGAERPTRTTVERDEPSKSKVDLSCQTSITASCLRELYNVGDYAADPKSGSRVGFGSFLNQSALHVDLFQYEDHNKIPRQDFTSVSIANGTLTQDASFGGYDEANLDVQTIVGVAPLPPRCPVCDGRIPVSNRPVSSEIFQTYCTWWLNEKLEALYPHAGPANCSRQLQRALRAVLSIPAVAGERRAADRSSPTRTETKKM